MESVRLRGNQLDEHVERAAAADYWKTLVPELSVGCDPVSGLLQTLPIADPVRDETVRRFGAEGYLHVRPILPATVVERMRTAVLRLIENDWPPVFGWVYDEFWRVSRVPALTELFSAVLGTAYRQTPFVWTHVVSGSRGSAGWPPHVDNRGDDFRLTVWIPLTDATVDTGCMSLIPKHLAPRGDGTRWYERAALSMSEVRGLLHASRPLPASAGAVVAWDAGLMHWGSARQTPGESRISLSMELVPATARPGVLEGTLEVVEPALPTHDERLRMIAAAIALYHPSEPRVARYTTLAERLHERLGRT
jgi:hypothetical protein